MTGLNGIYGIGARLDEDPGLFLKLRKARGEDLVTFAVKDTTRKLIEKTREKTKRAIADADLSSLFGIDMDGSTDSGRKKITTVKRIIKPIKSQSEKSIKKQRAKATPAKPGKPGATTKTGTAKKVKPPLDTVVGIIRRSRKGDTVAQLTLKQALKRSRFGNLSSRPNTEGSSNAGAGAFM